MTRIFRYWSALSYGFIILVAGILRLGGLTQIPYGLWVDEAWFGFTGHEVLQGVNLLPLREPNVGVGNSPFQIYAAALPQALGVPAAYSSRVASAVAGWLTVVILCPTLLVLFTSILPKNRGAIAALVGTAVMTTQFSGIHYSRDGGQQAACALTAVLFLLALYLTFYYVSWRWAILTGIALALALSTYEAAVGLVPIFFVYSGLRFLWPMKQPRRKILFLCAVGTGSALIAYSPLLLFYLQHPNIYLVHFVQTGNIGGDLADNIRRSLVGLWKVWMGISFDGDPMPGRNLAGRPLFDGFSSFFLWIGVLWILFRARQMPAAQLLLLWAGVMALPPALSIESPAFNRMLPMVPSLAGFTGLGVAAAWQAVSYRGDRVPGAAIVLAVLGLGAGGISSVWAYFVDWSHDPRLFDARYAGARLTAENALSLAKSDDVFITTKSQALVQMRFALLLGNAPVKMFDVTPDCFPYVNDSPHTVDYGIILVMDSSSLSALKAVYPHGTEVAPVMHPDGYAYSMFYQIPPHASAPNPMEAVHVEFDGGLRLIGYDLSGEARPGGQVTLKLYWETKATPSSDLIGFVHIGNGLSQPLIAQLDSPLCNGFTSTHWMPGYRYIEIRRLVLAQDAPPDTYDIRVGVYKPESGLRLTILSSDKPIENNRTQLTRIEVR